MALHWGAQRVGATVVNAGMGNTEKQMWAMKYMGTTAFHATPSYLIHLGTGSPRGARPAVEGAFDHCRRRSRDGRG